ncbi:MarR family winged helix-turn-helix transcriptional regulator [Komagataeibacter sp. FNDCF1]|uniref:MarR family winged helix-turn-helix transcriptional regulator n=1 Tax=Komagataeibacter sp. FNDCF1 TaxID=2878681 RepID=UPI001E4D5953|nr:MarR family transcriptional regulator [Komagataeibacter sp. FNDCF1]MCE2564261.1 MarR family transcriptional regulator [Komagataeibacter sp. FNDCF1]
MAPPRPPPIRSTPTGAGVELLFLRDEDMRQAQDLLMLACRSFNAVIDQELQAQGLGHAHYRIMQAVAQQPGLPVGGLLDLLGITKQSMGRALGELLTHGLIRQETAQQDRRQRQLYLTPRGTEIENRLFSLQREVLLRVYRNAGGRAVDGFRRVMRGLIDESDGPGVSTGAFSPSDRSSP